MAKNFKPPRSNWRLQRQRHFLFQKMHIQRAYPGFNCRILPNRNNPEKLVCTGIIQPDIDSPEYVVEIEYTGGPPQVRILRPEIRPKPEIHMYSDGTLCLYFPDEFKWKQSHMIHKTIINWIAEWLVFYERYLWTGKWEGPEAPHGNEGQKESGH